jgi:hypothetical protein
MKKLFLVTLFIALSNLFSFAGGDGSSGNPYQVSTPSELNDVRNYMGSYFIQTADIDMDVSPYNTGDGFEMIGYDWNPFTGGYNGNGFTISNLYINYTFLPYVGLFGFVNNYGNSLENITLVDADITGNTYVGSLVGGFTAGTISNCGASGYVSAGDHIGGLIGTIDNATVSGSYSNCSVEATGGGFAGGFAGVSTMNNISDCYSTGTVTSTDYAGGFFGDLNNMSTITNCYAAGLVDCQTLNEGGIAGNDDWSSTVTNTFWDTEATTLTSSIHGIGKNTTEMKTQSTYAGWDFTTPVWKIDTNNDGYPYLGWQNYGEPPVFAGGDGTISDPYQVSTPTQLNSVRDYATAYFIQTTDIDLNVPPYNTGDGWLPIGDGIFNFSGNYNGNDHSVSNLYVNRPDSILVGLFGYIENTTIKNIKVVNANVTGSIYTGCLLGGGSGSSVINCSSSGTVTGTSSVGGLAGTIEDSSTMTGCRSSGNVNGVDNVGGLIGKLYLNSGVSNNYSDCAVDASGDKSGGFVGLADNNVTITNCYSRGLVSGNTNAGGFSGSSTGTTTTSCYWDKETSGQLSSGGAEFDRSTLAMTYKNNYTNWDFTTPVWNIYYSLNDGYPYLESEGLTVPPPPFAGGDGTIGDPFQVSNADELNDVRYFPDSYFKQINNIDLDVPPYNVYPGWDPICGESGSYNFTGSYDGNGYKISGLYVNRQSSDYIGLFGKCFNSAELSDINLTDAVVKGKNYTGSLAGYIEDSVKVTNCGSDGDISGNNSTGGLIGSAQTSTVTDCNSFGNVSGSQNAGGLIGYADANTLTGCYSTSDVEVTGTGGAGGLAGYCYGSSIADCYADGSVSGAENIGGLFGFYFGNPSTENCYSKGLVTSAGTWVGGFGGYDNGTNTLVTSCYWDTETTGQSTSVSGIGKTTTEMRTQTTYIGWDFSTPVWDIDPVLNSGYPYLNRQSLVTTPFAGGNGSVIDPFRITNVNQLQSVNSYLGYNFILMNDINASETSTWNAGAGFVPLGNATTKFTGNFNGQNFTIDSLYIYLDHTWYAGLFGYIDSGSEVSNINLANANITGYVLAGGLVAKNAGSIYNCGTSGQITGSNTTGGFVGTNDWNADISNCYSTMNVTTDEYAGGFVAVNYGSIDNCYSNGFANCGINNYAGGFVSLNATDITNCYSIGTATGGENVGGFAGSSDGTLTSCYWDTETSGNPTSEGGTGKTSAQMKNQSTYVNWSFYYPWLINASLNSGYPFLKFQDLPYPIQTPQNITSEIIDNEFVVHWDQYSKYLSIKIYASDDPYGDFVEITDGGIFDGNSWSYEMTDNKKFFYIVAYNGTE